MPITPVCQFSLARTMLLRSGWWRFRSTIISQACLNIFRSYCWRCLFCSLRYSAICIERIGFSDVSSSTANRACPMRPAAFSIGARRKPMWKLSSRCPVSPADSIRACMPESLHSGSAFNPKLVSTLFSPRRSTISAMVPIAAKLVALSINSRNLGSSLRPELNSLAMAQANLNATIAPAESWFG
ncbi:hypothetical protein ES703_61240 [subsurface metagenome]